VTATDAQVARAAEVLAAGGLVAFPTETVYGLGADARSTAAVERLFAVKGRPADHPVIVHLGDAAQLDEWGVDITDAARTLTRACWPGPLTVVVRRAAHVPDAVTGGLDTVGLRVPHQRVARALLRAFGSGVAAPSANRFGRVSPTTAADVEADLGVDVDVVLDGGPSRVGVESTIVDCSRADPVVLRLGGVPRERIESLLGRAVGLLDSGEVRAPGTLASHYAPRAQVELVDAAAVGERVDRARARHERIGVIGVAVPRGRTDDGVVALGAPRDGDEYAHDLYRMLRDADARGVDRVFAVLPDAAGLGAAVADRLRRAAATSPATTPERAP
jgi:L-threonylcarbamoyladenylate synthase